MTKQDVEATLYLGDVASLGLDKLDVEKETFYAGRKNGAFLVFLTDPAKGKVVGLEQGRLTIGRDNDCGLVVAESYVSKKQAEITISGSKAAIRDYGSTNGTLVNNTPVKQVRLMDKDEIKIGHTILQYFCMDLTAADGNQKRSSADTETSAFYQQALREIEPYFGPMSVRFLNRQISAHVGGSPQTIAASDKAILAKWVRISASLLLDEASAKTLEGKVLSLK